MQTDHFLSLSVYVFGVAAVVLVMLGSYFLGQRHSDKAKNSPYESGILTRQSARAKFPAHFYVVAMIFVVFDIESVILYLWAAFARELGIFGLIQITTFSVLLLLGLAYLWRQQAFSFGPKLRRPVK